jgi:hypothetical protein
VAKFRSNQAEIARLAGSKGAVLSFEVDGVLARFTSAGSKKAGQSVDFKRSMGSVLKMVGITASHIRRRVRDRGELASGNKGYSRKVGRAGGRPRNWAVAEQYGNLVRGDASPARTSQQWHRQAGVRDNTFNTTGGMWRGLQVRQRGSDGAQIDFRGSSLGGTGKAARGFKKVKDKATGKTSFKEVKRQESTRLNVRNQHKAGRIMFRQGVNVVQPTAAENLAMAAAVAASAQIEVVNLFADQSKPQQSVMVGGIVSPGDTGDPKLFGLLMRRWVKR